MLTDIIIKDETTGESWGFGRSKEAYAEAYARAKSIIAKGHKLGGSKTLEELEYVLK